MFMSVLGLKFVDRKSVFRVFFLRSSAGRARVARSLHPRALRSSLAPCERRCRDESMTTDARTYTCVCVCLCVWVYGERARENEEPKQL